MFDQLVLAMAPEITEAEATHVSDKSNHHGQDHLVGRKPHTHSSIGHFKSYFNTGKKYVNETVTDWLSRIPGASTVINNAGNTINDNSCQSSVNASTTHNDSSSHVVAFHGVPDPMMSAAVCLARRDSVGSQSTLSTDSSFSVAQSDSSTSVSSNDNASRYAFPTIPESPTLEDDMVPSSADDSSGHHSGPRTAESSVHAEAPSVAPPPREAERQSSPLPADELSSLVSSPCQSAPPPLPIVDVDHKTELVAPRENHDATPGSRGSIAPVANPTTITGSPPQPPIPPTRNEVEGDLAFSRTSRTSPSATASPRLPSSPQSVRRGIEISDRAYDCSPSSAAQSLPPRSPVSTPSSPRVANHHVQAIDSTVGYSPRQSHAPMSSNPTAPIEWSQYHPAEPSAGFVSSPRISYVAPPLSMPIPMPCVSPRLRATALQRAPSPNSPPHTHEFIHASTIMPQPSFPAPQIFAATRRTTDTQIYSYTNKHYPHHMPPRGYPDSFQSASFYEGHSSSTYFRSAHAASPEDFVYCETPRAQTFDLPQQTSTDARREPRVPYSYDNSNADYEDTWNIRHSIQYDFE
ncbi:hypothetical protein SISNIDRAFT_532123 [Sistotremastrum niveocremeum HHB9708]|uniref:Uncharacterized protein n=1 Tax=Sistotremastrum niveocremeum HHB9708 TaxID=1314777 RepID=A0A164P0X4_9AGAM|nr:hypothetical protein SISNIDRAFT_532123 [Sistotremastrum niveocremeum HHB9708]